MLFNSAVEVFFLVDLVGLLSSDPCPSLCQQFYVNVEFDHLRSITFIFIDRLILNLKLIIKKDFMAQFKLMVLLIGYAAAFSASHMKYHMKEFEEIDDVKYDYDSITEDDIWVYKVHMEAGIKLITP